MACSNRWTQRANASARQSLEQTGELGEVTRELQQARSRDNVREAMRQVLEPSAAVKLACGIVLADVQFHQRDVVPDRTPGDVLEELLGISGDKLAALRETGVI